MAVTASFSAGTGNLSVFGDALNNTVTVGRNAAGTILVNGGAVKIIGGTATVANTKLIQAFGQSGDDFITHRREPRRDACGESVRRHRQ